MEAKDRERKGKELALLSNARVKRDMEIAEQIQLSLLPSTPHPCRDRTGRALLSGRLMLEVTTTITRPGGTYGWYAYCRCSGHSVGAA